jgi:hypothetical protein
MPHIIMLLWKKIFKDDLVLTCGVAFLEIEWTSVGPFFIDSSLNQTKYHIIYYKTK